MASIRVESYPMSPNENRSSTYIAGGKRLRIDSDRGLSPMFWFVTAFLDRMNELKHLHGKRPQVIFVGRDEWGLVCPSYQIGIHNDEPLMMSYIPTSIGGLDVTCGDRTGFILADGTFEAWEGLGAVGANALRGVSSDFYFDGLA